MNSILLSRILFGVILVLIVGIGFGFTQLTSILGARVTDRDHLTIDTEASVQEITKLRELDTKLKTQRDIIDRAKEIVANGKEFQFQNQIVSDITAYAARNNLVITSFNFSADNTTTTGGAAAPATPTPASPTPGGAAAAPPSTSQKVTATINLKTPVEYTDMLRFITQLENNLTKIQISTLNLSPDVQNPNQLLNPIVTIEVFLKK